MSLPSFKALVSSAVRVQAVKYATVSALVLQCHEWLICMSEEVEFVWQSHWGFWKILFIATRYMPYVDTPMKIAYYLMPAPSIKFCSIMEAFSTWFITIGMIISALVLLLRTIAIWGRSRKITVPLVLAWVLLATAACYFSAAYIKSLGYEPGPLPSVSGCYRVHGSAIAFGDFVILLVWELRRNTSGILH
ncbi:hypothetical protein K439DRAFT_1197098 [Ramaria rubella]|nr:hypothetical protein K439DRAFT_1197098 [Ramaria rubella]